MNDSATQLQTQTQNDNSYVDQYQPPAGGWDQSAPSPFVAPPAAMAAPPAASESQDVPVAAPQSDQAGFTPSNQPAIQAPPVADQVNQGVNSDGPSEALEDQNIFEMLGVSNGTEAQKESFLDELQQVIWEDFLEHDVQLLISNEEYQRLQPMLSERPTVDLEQQEKIVVFLEKLIPDLEEIMLEKALELKSDMFRERIAGMREYYTAESPEHTAARGKIDLAEQEMQRDRWHTAAAILNEI